MKLLKRIALFIILIIALGFLMPGNTHVERSATINAAAPIVFEQVNNLRKWTAWSPWSQIDPNTKWVYSDSLASGTGAWYTWSSTHKNVGNGKMTITDSKPNESVHYNLEFEGMGTSAAGFLLSAKDSTNTKVTWTMDMDNGLNPFRRWMGLFMDKMIGPDFEKGLTTMKNTCEQK